MLRRFVPLGAFVLVVAGAGGALSLGLGLGLALGGCSSDSGSSSGATSDAGNTGDAGGGGDASGATAVVNACKSFDDRSAAPSRALTWDFSIATGPDRCVQIKKGQDVTFVGDLVVHPITAFNGDRPNPITNVDASGKVTFPAVGTFGFQCGNHPAMTGAVHVVE